MNVKQFEDARWKALTQPIEFRHRAAVDLIEGGSVLDLGCGDGLLFDMLGDKISKAVGLDISPQAVEKCHEKGIEAVVHSFDEPVPYPDNSFEYVVLLDVLEHVYDPATLLAEAARVSSKYVIVGVPNFSSLPARLQTLRGKVPENNQPHKGHVYWFNEFVLQGVVSKAGLRMVEKRMNTFSVVAVFGEVLLRLFPNVFALSFVVKLEK